MADPAERAEPEASVTVGVKLHPTTYRRVHALAKRVGISVEDVLAVFVEQAVTSQRAERSAVLSQGRMSAAALALWSNSSTPLAEGLSTDGLDPDEDAYWRELHDLTGDEGDHAEAKPGSAPAR